MEVWGIGGAKSDTSAKLKAFKEQMGLTYPILYDEGTKVLAKYAIAKKNSPYPQDWIIGVDGRIRYFNNAYDVQAMEEVIEAELAKIKGK